MSFLALPNELLEQVSFDLPAHTAARLSRTCRRLYAVIDDPVLWKHYCQRDFELFKHCEHEVALQKPTRDHDWRRCYLQRIARNRRTMTIFEALLATQRQRFQRIEEIASIAGYECQETLDHCLTAEDGLHDTLARRYWADRVVRHAKRAHACNVWIEEATGPTGDQMTCEKAMAQFDLFLPGKSRFVSPALDKIAADIKTGTPGFGEMLVEQKVSAIIEHLRANRFLGETDVRQYHAVRNNFFSHALFSDDRSSMPLLTNVIFTAVAQRLDISARLCDFPNHIYSLVWRSSSSSRSCGDFYVNPWSDSQILSVEHMLQECKRQTDYADQAVMQSLAPAPSVVMLARATRNMQRSVVQESRDLVRIDDRYDRDQALFAAQWCNLIMTSSRTTLNHLSLRIRMNTPEDFGLVRHFVKNYMIFPDPGESHVFSEIGTVMRGVSVDELPVPLELQQCDSMIRERDTPNQVKRRKPVAGGADGVSYKIGQVFKHRRYGYIAVITGWDTECKQPAEWQLRMNVENLSSGTLQSYYNVLDQHGGLRYVAQENIEIVHTKPPQSMMACLGEHFLRWDDNEKKFVSNMLDDYPDD